MNARFLSAAVALLLCSAPALAAENAQVAAPAPNPSGVVEAKLKNGLQVLLLEDHAAPVATFSIFYKVGSRYEHTGNTGSAHLLEHMMFKGTKRFKKGEIMSALDHMGARWNATTFYDYTNYYETIPIERLDFVLGLEADRMQNSLILDKERDLERIVVRNELERGENSPMTALMHDVWSAAFLAHPYHHPVVGWRSDVEGVPTEQLRNFYKTFYRPDNAVAVLVGDFKAKDALAAIEKHFGSIPAAGSFPSLYTTEPAQRGERRITIRKPGDMKVVALGWKMPPAADKDTAAIKLLQLVLSGELSLGPFGDPLDSGIANRLYQGLVERELATGAGVDYVPMKDPGLFLVMATPRPDVDHARVEKTIRDLIAELRTKPVSADELARAKSRAAAAYGLMKDGTSGRAMLLGYFAAISDWRMADGFDALIKNVTADDLMRVANKYFDDSQLTVGWFVPQSAKPGEPAEQEDDTEHAALTTPRAHPQLATYKPFSPRDLTASAMAAVPAKAETSHQPAVEPRPRPDAPATRRTVLPNGLVVLVRENHASPTVSIAGSIKAGGVLDPPDSPHLAAITGDMLMRGTQTRSKLDIARSLEEVGASLGYDAGSEDVTVSAQGLSRDLDRILDLLADTLTKPAFPKEEVDKLKREAIAHLQQAEDSTGTRARRAFYQALYPKGHPYYVYSLDENVAAVQKLQPAALAEFHRTHYGADTTVLAVVGDVDADAVVKAIQKRLGTMPRLGGAKQAIPTVAMREAAAKTVVYVPEKSNVDVLIGHQGALSRTDPDYYPAMIANFAFGGSASARLFQEVRDRMGLTYGIYSTLMATHGAGPWSIWLTLNPQNVEKAIGVVDRMAAELVAKGLTDAELAAAKETLVGRYKVGLATNAGMAGALAAFEGYGFPPDMVERHPELVRAVTRADVARVLARDFHPDRAVTVIAGTYGRAPEVKPVSTEKR